MPGENNAQALTAIKARKREHCHGENRSEQVKYPPDLVRISLRQDIAEWQEYLSNEEVGNPYIEVLAQNLSKFWGALRTI